jgi:hypothetical protein
MKHKTPVAARPGAASGNARLRVIYTTGGGGTDGMTALFVDGGIFLPKPYRSEQLIQAIETASGSLRAICHDDFNGRPRMRDAGKIFTPAVLVPRSSI